MAKKVIACAICGAFMSKERLREHLLAGHKKGLRRVESRLSVTYVPIKADSIAEEERRALLALTTRKPRQKKKKQKKKKNSNPSQPKNKLTTTRSQAIGRSRVRLWS